MLQQNKQTRIRYPNNTQNYETQYINRGRNKTNGKNENNNGRLEFLNRHWHTKLRCKGPFAEKEEETQQQFV